MKFEYKRVLLKLSGEMLGENGRLFDHGIIDHVIGPEALGGVAEQAVGADGGLLVEEEVSRGLR